MRYIKWDKISVFFVIKKEHLRLQKSKEKKRQY